MTLRSCLGDVVLYAAIGLLAPPVVLVLGALNCFIGVIVLLIGIIIGKHVRQYNSDTRTMAKGAA
jgi:hypothetical protein